MARRRKTGIRKYAILTIVIVLVGGALIFAVPEIGEPIFGAFLVSTEQARESVSGWSFGDQFVSFAVAPNVNLECFNQLTLSLNDVAGRSTVFSRSAIKAVPVETFFSVVPITGGDAIKDISGRGNVACNIQFGTGQIVGGSVTTKWITLDNNLNVVTIKEVVRGITDTGAIGSTSKSYTMPIVGVTASEIQNAVNLPSTVASKFVPVTAQVTYYLAFSTTATGNKVNIGQNVLSTGSSVKVVNDAVTQTPPPSEKTPNITKVDESQLLYIGSATPLTPDPDKQITSGENPTIVVTGRVKNWVSGDPVPVVNIYDPSGFKRTSKVPMAQSRQISSTEVEFVSQPAELGITFTDNTINTFKGVWFAEMSQTQPAGAPRVDRQNFAVNDGRGTVPTKLVCTSPKVPDPTDTFCIDAPDPTEPLSCDPITLNNQLDQMSSQEISTLLQELVQKEALNQLTQCEKGQLPIIKNVATSRGIAIPTSGGNGGTTPVTDVTQTKGFARFLAEFAPTGDISNRDCKIEKNIPSQGVTIGAFQLIGLGTECADKQFARVEIRPVLDFGEVADDIQIDQLLLTHKLTLTKDFAFPASPSFDCTGGSDEPLQKPDCVINNSDPSKFLPASGFASGQIDTSAQQQGFSTGFPTQYQLSLIKLTEADIRNQVEGAGVVLTEGDTYAYLAVVNGVFKGTAGGVPIIGIISPIAVSQDFTFTEEDFSCDTSISYIDADPNSSSFGSCIPLPPEECPTGQTYDLDLRDCVDIPDFCLPPNSIQGGVCLPTQPSGGCTGTQILDQQTGECREPFCPAIPTCAVGKTLSTTSQIDDCGNNVLQCIAVVGGGGTTCPVGTTGTPPNCVPNEGGAGGCPAGQTRNTLGQCQTIGGGGGGGTTGGGSENSGFCTLDNDFNFSQCLSSVLGGEGSQPFMLEGASLTAVYVFVLGIILLIIVAVVVRIRRGGGFKVP